MPYVTASVAVVGVWLFLFSGERSGQHAAGAAGARPDLADQPDLGHALDRLLRDLEAWGFYILLYLAALQNVGQELYEAAADRRCRPAGRASGTSPCPASVRRPCWSLLLATVTGANLFTEPYLLTGGGGPNGASASPVLIMYQQGIEQGKPGYAAAIGIVLVIGTLIIAALQNRFAGGRD